MNRFRRPLDLSRLLRHKLPYKKKGVIPVTVCVAAISEEAMLFGASDRMITSGDIQFQPPQTKLFNLTSSIVMMSAGDVALQSEVIYGVRQIVNARIEQEPLNWWNVSDIGELYRKSYNQVCARLREQQLLAPLGLTSETFLSRQREMAPTLVEKIATELINSENPTVQTIITGIDNTGPHIYVANGGSITCQDGVGFAAIGAGYWHADSQLMFAEHTRRRDMAETLLSVYAAKKRAEVAPGVGENTDMFTIGPALGSYVTMRSDVIEKLDELYRQMQAKFDTATKEANEQVKKYVEEIIAAATPTQQEAGSSDNSDGPEATDEKKPDSGPKKIEGPKK
jgi:hypothetical protein